MKTSRFDIKIALLALGALSASLGCSIRMLPVASTEEIAAPISCTELTLSVLPVYPASGDDWMEFVENDGATARSGSDTACDGDSTIDGTGPRAGGTNFGYDICIHGGEMKKVLVPGASSCGTLSLSDDNSVFEWSCDDSSGAAVFYTAGFKAGKGLKDLVDATSWLDNHVTVSGSSNGTCYEGESAAEPWWSVADNPVVPLPDNSAGGDTTLGLDSADSGGNDDVFVAGTVFTLSASRATHGYNLNLHRLSLVTLGGATLSYTGGGTDNCVQTTGEMAAADTRCLIAAGSQNYLWIEGSFTAEGGATDAEIGLNLASVQYSRVHQVEIESAAINNLFNYSANRNIYDTVTLQNSAARAIVMRRSSYNRVKKLTLANNNRGISLTNAGLAGQEPSYNRFTDLKAMNNGEVGSGTGTTVHIENGFNNIFSRVLVSSAELYSLDLDGAAVAAGNNVVTAYTAANGVADGFYFGGTGSGKNSTLHLGAFSNMTQSGVGFANGVTNGTASQVAIANHGDHGITIDATSNNNSIVGNLLIGTNKVAGTLNDECLVDAASTGNNLPDNTTDCSGGAGYALNSGITLASSFYGKVTTEDSVNSSDTLGAAAWPASPATFDFANFENFFRGWGEDGAAFPASTNRSTWGSGNGRIWDFRLLASDTLIRNTTGDGLTQNDAFIEGDPCPLAVHGNKTATDQHSNGGANTYLLSAIEIFDDELGDEDGLCETGETCLYAPNFGAYQGHGNLIQCEFDDDGGTTTVTGVTMFGYEENGATP